MKRGEEVKRECIIRDELTQPPEPSCSLSKPGSVPPQDYEQVTGVLTYDIE